MTRAWIFVVTMLAPAVCGLLSGCAASEPMSMDSNSNWLRSCDTSSECSTGEVCACGVCTVACVEDATCERQDGPEAVCVAIDDGRCEGRSRGAVCLEVCERMSQCADELSCSDGACGSFTTSSPSDDEDAGLDAGMTQDATPDAETDPLDSTVQPDSATSGAYAGPGCEPADVERVPCSAIGECEEGRVCHIDGTCITPGLCDADGVTTLAEVSDIRALQKDGTHLYLLEYGSTDMFGNHNNDGAIVRIPQLGGALLPVVTGLQPSWSMLRVDATRVYWTQGLSTRALWTADKVTGDGVEVLVDDDIFAMEPNGDHVYYVVWVSSDEPPRLERVNKASGQIDIVPSDGLSNGLMWGFDVDEGGFYFAIGPSFYRLPLEGGSASVLEDGIAVDGTGIASGRDSVFLGHGYGGLSAVPKAGGAAVRLSALPTDEWIGAIVPHHDYVYGLWSTFGSVSASASIVRIPITPGDLETLVTLPGETPFTVTDRGLFWVQDNRLLRKVIPEFYAEDHGPAEGELGGPCFGDLTCSSGLACIETVCQHIPFRGAGCTPADALRPSCSGPGQCATGQVCHLDGTCIEPGTCDATGTTTLAEVGSVRRIASDARDLYLLDPGTEDELGNHNTDGAIRRLPLLGGSVESVVDGLGRTNDLLIDADRLFWSEGQVTDLTLWRADKLDGANKGAFASADNLHWVQDAGHIYFVTENADDSMQLFRIAKNGSEVEPLAEMETFAEIAVDSQRVYGYGVGLWSVALDGGSTVPIASAQGPDSFGLGPDNLYYGSSLDGRVRMVPKGGGEGLTLSMPSDGGWTLELQPYRNHVYLGRTDGEGKPQLQRAPITPGTTETLAAWPGSANHRHDVPFTVNDQGLYWIQGGRLVRKVLYDEAAASSPAQGTVDGPCYGDLSCDGSLRCVDARCQ